MAIKPTLLLLLTSLLTACLMGPDYKRPRTIVPTAFKETQRKNTAGKAKKNWKRAEPSDNKERGPWWTVFHDNTLNQLLTELNRGNQNIATAYANYKQAKAMVDQARSYFYPTVNLLSLLTKQKNSGGVALFPNASTSAGLSNQAGSTTSGSTTPTQGFVASNAPFTSYFNLLGGSWQPDVWGAVHRSVEASKAAAQSSAALLANTRLSMQGMLAQTYFELRALDRDQQLLDQTVQSYKKLLVLTQNQYKSGIVSRANVLQALGQLETAEAQAINNGVNRASYEHAIAVLLGRPPANFSLKADTGMTTPPVIPLAVPSELLERRPDIAQAERLVEQASAQIGVAIAAYFPKITLNGNINDFGILGVKLLSPTGWSYSAQLSELVYDGGYRSSVVRQARAGFKSAVSAYRQTVLAAFQNVEDNLSNLRIFAEQSRVLAAAVNAANQSLNLVIDQYKSGIVDAATIYNAQITFYTAKKNASDVNGLRMTSAVGLITALGGGWGTQCIACAADPQQSILPVPL